MKSVFKIIPFLIIFSSCFGQKKELPASFVYVEELIPDILVDLRYAGTDNFMGVPVNGYNKKRLILSRPAAEALKKVQEEAGRKGFRLKIFDAYRPQRAVNHFMQWARQTGDTLKKQEFYPHTAKSELFELGYLASRSGHSRGSTVDLTLVYQENGRELDMGGPYDFFGSISAHDTGLINKEQRQNREFLKSLMVKHGFKPYSKEWWHYSLRQEPFPDTYFDFVVE